MRAVVAFGVMKRERGRAGRTLRAPARGTGTTGERSLARARAEGRLIEDHDTAEERRLALEQMQTAWLAFYGQATRIGCHAFLEFSGLMAKFIDLCRAAETKGKPWLRANVHSGQHLLFADHDLAYLLEKLECIYGMHFRLDQRLPDAAPIDPRRRGRAATR